MALFYTEFLSINCSDVQAAKKWWLATFDCKETNVPLDWDDPLPSDVALKLSGNDKAAILLRDKTEMKEDIDGWGRDPGDSHALIFCSNLKKAHEQLRLRNAAVDQIQEGGGTQFFNIRDPEGHVIEICKEP